MSVPHTCRADPSGSGAESPKLYHEFAAWWPLLSAPADDADEAAFVRQTLLAACHGPLETLLELGSGGGNVASHLKAHVRMTLVARAAALLAVSRALNPECEHSEGDMRSVRLAGDHFDAVLIHDAIMYMTTDTDGPVAETKEQLGGFILINARDLNDAIQVASKIPPGHLGSVEVRPIWEIKQP
jgi:YCII-related domain/Methyltransferase domain